jgi:integrase
MQLSKRLIERNKMLEKKLLTIISTHAGTRANGKVASERTFTARKESLLASFRQLIDLGYRLQCPKNITEKHVKALMDYWLYTKKSKPKTIESSLSNLRLFGDWIGKTGMVKSKYDYVKQEDRSLLRVDSAARSSKSWTGNNINLDEIFERVDLADERFGLILRMQIAFGLRREEALKCKPHLQDFNEYFRIEKGHGKGGKVRSIPTITSSQIDLIKQIKMKIGRFDSLGWQYTKDGQVASLKQNLKRYDNLMKACGITKAELGVTGHGLRAQFSENNALANGLIPPSMGGMKNQMSKQQRKTITEILSEAMGHHRTVVMSAYYCAFKKDTTEEAAEKFMSDIGECLDRINLMDLEPVDQTAWADCVFIREKLEILGIDISLKQIQYLWKIYSERHLVSWIKPEHHVAICLHYAVLSFNVNAQMKVEVS